MEAPMTTTKPSSHDTSGGRQIDDDTFVTEFFGAVAPGAKIILILQELGITPRQAAAKAGIPYEIFFGIMAGVDPITEQYAKKLSMAVRGNEHYWLRSEKGYQADLLRDGLERPVYDPAEADRVADQILGPAEDGLTEMELPVFSTLDYEPPH